MDWDEIKFVVIWVTIAGAIMLGAAWSVHRRTSDRIEPCIESCKQIHLALAQEPTKEFNICKHDCYFHLNKSR